MWKDSPENRRSRYERILKKSSCFGNVTFQAENEEEEKIQNLNMVCQYVLAPALHGYVSWVLNEALASGKQRLYFLARDAYLMYRTAVEICKAENLSIQCVYLSCSRYSIRVPMYHLDFEETLEYVCRGGIDVTLHKMLNRAALTEEEQCKVLWKIQEKAFPNLMLNEKLSYASLDKIRTVLREDSYFKSCVEEHSRAAMPLLEEYLVQEGLLDDIPYALVDSGWVGSMQKVLNRLLDYIREKRNLPDPKQPMEGYYWGLYELPEQVIPGEYHSYYFSPGDHIKEKVYFSNCLFECVFSAPHGMTLGYRREGERVIPVYGEIPEEQLSFMKQLEVQMASCTVTFLDAKNRMIQLPASEKLSTTARQKNLEEVNAAAPTERTVIAKLLQLFMGEPSRWEAELFGSLGFSDDVLDEENGNRQIADRLSEEELTANHVWRKILAMCGIGNKYVRESAWYEGSAVRGGKHVKTHLRRYAAYKYLLYLRKRYRWRKIYG